MSSFLSAIILFTVFFAAPDLRVQDLNENSFFTLQKIELSPAVISSVQIIKSHPRKSNLVCELLYVPSRDQIGFETFSADYRFGHLNISPILTNTSSLARAPPFLS